MAIDAFLVLDGFKGEAIDAVFTKKKAIAVSSFTFGSQGNTSDIDFLVGNEGGEGRAKIQGKFEKLLKDKMTPREYEEFLKNMEERESERDDAIKSMSEKLKKTRDELAKKSQKAEAAFSFEITKTVDTSSTGLFLNYCRRQQFGVEHKPIETAKLYLRKSGNPKPITFFSIQFRKLHVISFSWDCPGVPIPTETIGFSFGTCVVKYRPQTLKGEQGEAIIQSWNFQNNTTQVTDPPDNEFDGLAALGM